MTRRHGPEEHFEDCPLFDNPSSAAKLTPEQTEARVVEGMKRAADRAERLEPGWKVEALEAVRRHALTHEYVMSEDVRLEFGTPQDADPRAWGPIMRSAASNGWIAYTIAVRDQWGSYKARWKSLVFRGESQ